MRYILIFFFNIVNSFNLKIPKLYNKYIKKYSQPTTFEIINNDKFYKFGSNPRLESPNDYGQLTWYAIGLSKDIRFKQQKKVTVRDINYIIWKDNHGYYGLRDVCSHQGSSFQGGNIKNDTISCPYHGYIFNGTFGNLIEIPKLKIKNNNCYNVDSFKVIEKNGIIFLNTIPLTLENYNIIDPKYIWLEPEANDPTQKAIYITEDFEHYAKFVTLNSLDICHIGFVHTFGNRKNPIPVSNSNIQKCNDSSFHYKINYEYLAGDKSIVNKIYKFEKINVENEYIQAHTTVARVLFGKFSSTIITIAQPISKFKTKLYVKAYRNYWYFNESNNFFEKIHNSLINNIGNLFTYYTMFETLKQDKVIVDNIDKTNYELMHGKFCIKYDMMSNHYKHNYKKYFELDENNI